MPILFLGIDFGQLLAGAHRQEHVAVFAYAFDRAIQTGNRLGYAPATMVQMAGHPPAIGLELPFFKAVKQCHGAVGQGFGFIELVVQGERIGRHREAEGPICHVGIGFGGGSWAGIAVFHLIGNRGVGVVVALHRKIGQRQHGSGKTDQPAFFRHPRQARGFDQHGFGIFGIATDVKHFADVGHDMRRAANQVEAAGGIEGAVIVADRFVDMPVFLGHDAHQVQAQHHFARWLAGQKRQQPLAAEIIGFLGTPAAAPDHQNAEQAKRQTARVFTVVEFGQQTFELRQRRVEFCLIEVGKGQAEFSADSHGAVVDHFGTGEQVIRQRPPALGIVAHQVERIVAAVTPVVVLYRHRS